MTNVLKVDFDITLEKLSEVRDLLLPALRMLHAQFPALIFAIDIDRYNKALLIRGLNDANKRSLGFAITTASIADKHYLQTFKPTMDKLVELLMQEAAPVGTHG